MEIGVGPIQLIDIIILYAKIPPFSVLKPAIMISKRTV